MEASLGCPGAADCPHLRLRSTLLGPPGLRSEVVTYSTPEPTPLSSSRERSRGGPTVYQIQLEFNGINIQTIESRFHF